MVKQLSHEVEMLRKARLEMGYTQQQVATLIVLMIKMNYALSRRME